MVVELWSIGHFYNYDAISLDAFGPVGDRCLFDQCFLSPEHLPWPPAFFRARNHCDGFQSSHRDGHRNIGH